MRRLGIVEPQCLRLAREKAREATRVVAAGEKESHPDHNKNVRCILSFSSLNNFGVAANAGFMI